MIIRAAWKEWGRVSHDVKTEEKGTHEAWSAVKDLLPFQVLNVISTDIGNEEQNSARV